MVQWCSLFIHVYDDIWYVHMYRYAAIVWLLAIQFLFITCDAHALLSFIWQKLLTHSYRTAKCILYICAIYLPLIKLLVDFQSFHHSSTPSMVVIVVEYPKSMLCSAMVNISCVSVQCDMWILIWLRTMAINRSKSIWKLFCSNHDDYDIDKIDRVR